MLRNMLIVLIFLVTTISPAFCSESFDFVIIQPGQPGTSEDAQPVMDALATYLQSKLGTEVTIRGRYLIKPSRQLHILRKTAPSGALSGLVITWNMPVQVA